jgi:LysM repeat protein
MGEDADVAVVEERYAVVEPRNPFEWLNFAILVAVFIIAILVVALSRPFIFGRVVPAVLGEDQPTAPLVEDVDQTIKEVPEEGATGGLEETEPAGEETAGEEPAGEEAAPVTQETPTAEEFPTSVPTVTHVVQRGETLHAIARQYGTTVDAIVQANNITNPNRVNVGTSLLIPQP